MKPLATLVMFPFLVVAKALAILLGLFVVAIALPFAKESTPPALPSTVNRTVADGWKYIALPKWANWLWGNDKYGAEGNWFWNGKTFWKRYVWLALRNPANNLQRYSLFRFDTDPKEVRWIGDKLVDDVRGFSGFQIAWQGWHSGLYWIIPYKNIDKCLRIRLGYKINPCSKKSESAALSVLIHPYANFGK